MWFREVKDGNWLDVRTAAWVEGGEPFRVWASLPASWLGGSHLELVKCFPIGCRVAAVLPSSPSHGAPDAGHHPGSLASENPFWMFL